MSIHTLPSPASVRHPASFDHGLGAVESASERIAAWPDRWLAVTRLAIGFIFLWAFLDKTLGLGYSTASADAWIRGGSPTRGFLSHVTVGPLASTFQSWAGNTLVDVVFMLGLLGVGAAFVAGLALRPAALAGTVMLAFMWVAEWPPARNGSAGPTGSTNPFVDYHVIYALALIVVAALSTGARWGLGAWWARLPVVRDHGFLR